MRQVIALILVSLIVSCKNDFLSDKPIKIAEIEVHQKSILIYKSFSNATVEESIQIRTSMDSLNSKKVYKRYDILVDYSINAEDLELVLKDTSGRKVKVDTFIVDVSTLWD